MLLLPHNIIWFSQFRLWIINGRVGCSGFMVFDSSQQSCWCRRTLRLYGCAQSVKVFICVHGVNSSFLSSSWRVLLRMDEWIRSTRPAARLTQTGSNNVDGGGVLIFRPLCNILFNIREGGAVVKENDQGKKERKTERKNTFPKSPFMGWIKSRDYFQGVRKHKKNKLLIYSLQQNAGQLPYLGSKAKRKEMEDKNGNRLM